MQPTTSTCIPYRRNRVRRTVFDVPADLWVNSNLDKSAWLSDTERGQATSWLILGSDERDGSVQESYTDVTGTRTDTILVLTKPKNGASSLISIPRDSLVKINGKSMKINAVYQFYGKKRLVSTVETITGQKIDHVAMVKFGGVMHVVDALGGVELCYDHTVNDPNSGMVWQSGCHVADGGTALAFSRMRYSDPNGDFGRAARQRQVIGAIMNKATSSSTLTKFSTTSKVAKAALQSVSVDDDTTPATLLSMVTAFRNASSSKGVTGSVYWIDPGYYVSGHTCTRQCRHLGGIIIQLTFRRNTQEQSETANAQGKCRCLPHPLSTFAGPVA